MNFWATTVCRKHSKTHNALLIFYPQLIELKSDFPPDGGLHVPPVDNQARTGNPVVPKVLFPSTRNALSILYHRMSDLTLLLLHGVRGSKLKKKLVHWFSNSGYTLSSLVFPFITRIYQTK